MSYKTLLLVGILLIGTLSSCAVQQVQGLEQYKQAVTCYEAKNYTQASRLLKEALPLIQGKQEASKAQFMLAYCQFHCKDYVQSADSFQTFYLTFSRDPHKEEALYKQGEALYLASPDERLDAQITQEAVSALAAYQDQYPAGTYIEQAAQYHSVLNDKLGRKAFRNARLYYTLACYQAAVVALHNFQQDFPVSSYNEEAAYLKADAQHRFAQMAPIAARRGELVIALRYCHEFLDHYADSPYKTTVQTIYESCLSLIDQLASHPKS